MTTVDREARAEAYSARADRPMAILAIVFLLVFTAVVVWTDLPPACRIIFAVVSVLIWLAFVVDLIVRVALAQNRGRWLLTHPLDVLAVMFPAFRPLKILAVIGDRRLRAGTAVARTSQAVVIAAVLLIWVCSVAVLAIERDAEGASIVTIGDAVWWAFVTIATVGYGDMVPVTAGGRGVGIVLMVVGLALVAIITASVASWFVAHTQEDSDLEVASRDAEHRDRILKLERKIDRLLEAEARRDEPGRERG